MNTNKDFTRRFKASLVLSVAACVTALSACWSTAKFSPSFPERQAAAQSSQAVLPANDFGRGDFDFLQGLGDVCLYKKLDYMDKPEGKRLYELMKAGYPKEISLEEAVAVANKFAQCSEVGKTQPPLRAEEIVASIRDWVCEDDKDVKDKKSCGEFWRIAETQRIPKGAFIDFTSGRSLYKGYDVDAWRVDLYIRLDKHRRDLIGQPSFQRLIRLNYISSRPTNGA